MIFSKTAKQSFSAGNSNDAYRYMGAHKVGDRYIFRVWAPNARAVQVVGDFNSWDISTPCMTFTGDGIWEAEIADAKIYDNYKYRITKQDGSVVLKSDPYAFHCATRPDNASKLYDLSGYSWHDKEYLKKQESVNILRSPVSIYEVHLGSWRVHEDGNPYSYSDLAKTLPDYVKEMGYTHIEILPITEYPYDPSWGYQVTGFYAPTSRYGTPKDFMHLVDVCHQKGIGVILDWVGAHFPKDEHGLMEFDGSCLYESDDRVMNEHPEWHTRLFNYERNEVRSFLTSSVCFWLNKYHIDGIRIDAVASMLYLDYGRRNGNWHPNRHGGNINEGAVSLLQTLNKAAFTMKPSVMMMAEESTAFPLVTKPDYLGGLGFNFKWNMGWMHDTLDYFSADPLFRKGMHDKLTFSLTYAFSENFVLPFSHDEVVHGKKSLIGRMPGNYDDKFTWLRGMYAYMYAHPGKKLNFMGSEFGQFIEWDFKKELDWLLLDYEKHRGIKEFVKDLNRLYQECRPLWECDDGWHGFQWICADDKDQSVVSFARADSDGNRLIAVCNFCPNKRENYRIGIPLKENLLPLICSTDVKYGGNDTLNNLKIGKTEDVPMHGFQYSVALDIPPSSSIYFKLDNK